MVGVAYEYPTEAESLAVFERVLPQLTGEDYGSVFRFTNLGRTTHRVAIVTEDEADLRRFERWLLPGVQIELSHDEWEAFYARRARQTVDHRSHFPGGAVIDSDGSARPL